VPVDIDLLLCKSNNVDEAEAGHGQVKKKKMVVVSSQTIFLVARVKLNGREKKKETHIPIGSIESNDDRERLARFIRGSIGFYIPGNRFRFSLFSVVGLVTVPPVAFYSLIYGRPELEVV
jgi:hypothetical protein